MMPHISGGYQRKAHTQVCYPQNHPWPFRTDQSVSFCNILAICDARKELAHRMRVPPRDGLSCLQAASACPSGPTPPAKGTNSPSMAHVPIQTRIGTQTGEPPPFKVQLLQQGMVQGICVNCFSYR